MSVCPISICICSTSIIFFLFVSILHMVFVCLLRYYRQLMQLHRFTAERWCTYTHTYPMWHVSAYILEFKMEFFHFESWHGLVFLFFFFLCTCIHSSLFIAVRCCCCCCRYSFESIHSTILFNRTQHEEKLKMEFYGCAKGEKRRKMDEDR